MKGTNLSLLKSVIADKIERYDDTLKRNTGID